MSSTVKMALVLLGCVAESLHHELLMQAESNRQWLLLLAAALVFFMQASGRFAEMEPVNGPTLCRCTDTCDADTTAKLTLPLKFSIQRDLDRLAINPIDATSMHETFYIAGLCISMRRLCKTQKCQVSWH